MSFNDPYRVLGVSQDADMDEIKKQYRTLSRKYHPDTNINNPNKAQAEEKFKEVQAAYEQIVDEREHGRRAGASGSSSYGGFGGFGGFDGFGYGADRGSAAGTDYERAAANYINSRHFREALNTLSNQPASERTARWYYLSAIANSGLGYTVTAVEHARTAVRMEPGNGDYVNLLNALQNGGTWYSDTSSSYGNVDIGRNCLYCLLCNCLCGGPRFCCF